MSKLPEASHPCVSRVIDPPGDGNCGFNCVRYVIKKTSPNPIYQAMAGAYQVRLDLIEELESCREWYEQTTGKSYSTLMKTLEMNSPHDLLRNHIQWLSTWKHGHMLANAYRRPVIFISKETRDGNFTIIPDFHHFQPVEPLVMAHVDDCHWMQVEFPAQAPFSPYLPVSLSQFHQNKGEPSEIEASWLGGLRKHFEWGQVIFRGPIYGHS